MLRSRCRRLRAASAANWKGVSWNSPLRCAGALAANLCCTSRAWGHASDPKRPACRARATPGISCKGRGCLAGADLVGFIPLLGGPAVQLRRRLWITPPTSRHVPRGPWPAARVMNNTIALGTPTSPVREKSTYGSANMSPPGGHAAIPSSASMPDVTSPRIAVLRMTYRKLDPRPLVMIRPVLGNEPTQSPQPVPRYAWHCARSRDSPARGIGSSGPSPLRRRGAKRPRHR
jgi:hypothetical protein